MRTILDDRDDMIGNFLYHLNLAMYAGLTDDRPVVISELRTALKTGMRGLPFLDDVIFDPYRADPEFVAIRSEMVALVDEQRAILGMPPYRPVQPTEERPTFVN